MLVINNTNQNAIATMMLGRRLSRDIPTPKFLGEENQKFNLVIALLGTEAYDVALDMLPWACLRSLVPGGFDSFLVCLWNGHCHFKDEKQQKKF